MNEWPRMTLKHLLPTVETQIYELILVVNIATCNGDDIQRMSICILSSSLDELHRVAT